MVVDRIAVDVVTDIIEDSDEWADESCAIPSESYCERAIDGTTKKIKCYFYQEKR
jgi:hypothetical protein